MYVKRKLQWSPPIKRVVVCSHGRLCATNYVLRLRVAPDKVWNANFCPRFRQKMRFFPKKKSIIQKQKVAKAIVADMSGYCEVCSERRSGSVLTRCKRVAVTLVTRHQLLASSNPPPLSRGSSAGGRSNTTARNDLQQSFHNPTRAFTFKTLLRHCAKGATQVIAM